MRARSAVARTFPRMSLTAVALPLLLTLGACAQPAAPPEPAVPVPPPAELARFYDQELTFGPCEGYATTAVDEQVFAADEAFECARLEVPLDYDEPEGGTAQIAMLRVPARGEPMGSLLLNSGGPGGPGMQFAAVVGTTLAQNPITERFDLIGFDPRGVAASTPAIDCFTDEELRGGAQTEFTFSAGAFTEADTRRLAERCAQRSGGEQVLAHVASRNTVRDMDVLRAALGDEQLNFFGHSYGTRIGALYAEAFPQNVRAMVLDGAVAPELGNDRRLSQYTGFQRSFDVMAADCTTRPHCPLGTDPTRTTEAFHSIVRPLLDRPVPTGDGQEVDFNGAIGGIISGLYDQAKWPRITAGLAQVQAGRGDELLALQREFAGEGNFTDANLAIGCMDEQRMSPDEAADFRRKIYEKVPFADPGGSPDGARDACGSWPAEPKPAYPFPDRVEGLPPTLTISITGDPSTPYEAGTSLAETLGGSMVTVEGEQHTVLSSGASPCVNDIAADYLVNLTVPPAEARCTL